MSLTGAPKTSGIFNNLVLAGQSGDSCERSSIEAEDTDMNNIWSLLKFAGNYQQFKRSWWSTSLYIMVNSLSMRIWKDNNKGREGMFAEQLLCGSL